MQTVGHFVSYSKAYISSYLHFLKDLSKASLNISKCSHLFQTNKLVIPLQQHGGKDDPVLSFATKC